MEYRAIEFQIRVKPYRLVTAVESERRVWKFLPSFYLQKGENILFDWLDPDKEKKRQEMELALFCRSQETWNDGEKIGQISIKEVNVMDL